MAGQSSDESPLNCNNSDMQQHKAGQQAPLPLNGLAAPPSLPSMHLSGSGNSAPSGMTSNFQSTRLITNALVLSVTQTHQYDTIENRQHGFDFCSNPSASARRQMQHPLCWLNRLLGQRYQWWSQKEGIGSQWQEKQRPHARPDMHQLFYRFNASLAP